MKKNIIDVSINLHKKMYGNQPTIINYDLYFDETNNIRKARLIPNGTNADIEHQFFVLGGIAIKSDIKINKVNMYKELNLQSNINDLKFKHLCPHRENFENIIKSNKLLSFLEYLKNESIYIHFHIFDYMYWALSDITDSLFDENDINQTVYFMFYNKIKSDFVEVLCKDYNKIINFLYSFSFPNISKNNVNNFIKTIYNYYIDNLEQYYDVSLPINFSKELLRQMIKSKLKKDTLIFLEDNEDYILCKEFEYIYLQSMTTFMCNKKFYDEEKNIMDKLNLIDNEYEKKLNCQWLNSKDSIEIQLSDCMCGFISHLFNYLSISNIKDINELVKKLDKDSIGYKVLVCFFELYDKSANFCKFLICRTLPEYFESKFVLLYDLIKNK